MKYKASITLRHDSGHDNVVEISGDDAMQVSHIANTIRRSFGVSAREQTHRVNGIIKDEFSQNESQSFWREHFDFLRDFFHLRKRT